MGDTHNRHHIKPRVSSKQRRKLNPIEEAKDLLHFDYEYGTVFEILRNLIYVQFGGDHWWGGNIRQKIIELGLNPDAKALWLDLIELPESLQRKGTGRAIVQQLAMEAKEQGADYVIGQAGELDHGSSLPFWLNLGAHVIANSGEEPIVWGRIP